MRKGPRRRAGRAQEKTSEIEIKKCYTSQPLVFEIAVFQSDREKISLVYS